MVSVFPSVLCTNVAILCILPRTVTSQDHLALEVIVKVKRFLTNYDAPPRKKGEAAETVRLQRKKMPYFSDNRSRLRREQEDGPAEIPGDHDAVVCVEVLIL